MPQEIKTTLDFKNVGKIVNLPDGVDPQDAATVAQLATGVGTAIWGGISGSLSSQTDLQSALDGKESTIAAGTSSQYWRGDKTWQTLPLPVWGSITGSINDQTDLISGGKILSSLLPALAITDTSVVSSEAAMLALTAETGDIAVRTDETKTYILKGTDPSVLADWELLLTPTGGVVSVFGRSGAVTAQSGDYSFSLISGTAGPTQGGTGLTSYAKGDVLIATGTNTVGVVAASATDGYVFTWDLASGLPIWKAAAGGLPSQTGNSGKFLTTDGTVASWGASPGWGITGNAGTTAGTNFIGTTDDVAIIFKQNNVFSGILGKVTTNGTTRTILGYSSGLLSTDTGAWDITAFGSYALSNCNAFGNAAFGSNSLRACTTGVNNTAIGNDTGKNITTGSGNMLMGFKAGNSLTTQSNNVFIGVVAGSASTGHSNTFISGGALATTSTESVGVGIRSINSTLTGIRACAIGTDCMSNTTSGAEVTGVGYAALYANTSGSNNLGLGSRAGRYNTTASNQIFISTLDRGNYSGDQNGSPIYIQQNSNVTAQKIALNGVVGINTISPEASSALDISSTTKGFLPPRMTTTQRTAIASPAEGLTVYDISLHKLYTFDGTTWQAVW